MDGIDDIAKASYLLDHFKAMDEKLDVLHTRKDDKHVFELYVRDFTLGMESKLERHLDVYDKIITRKRTQGDNNPYYKIEIEGILS
jgi:hypothetical protein